MSDIQKTSYFVNKTFMAIILLLLIEIVLFISLWTYHRLDYVKTGCAQFKRAGFYHITKESKLYSYGLDPDKDGIDCE